MSKKQNVQINKQIKNSQEKNVDKLILTLKFLSVQLRDSFHTRFTLNVLLTFILKFQNFQIFTSNSDR